MAKLEKAGIPTVIIDLPDQDDLLKLEALRAGVPNIRYVNGSRTVPGPEDVDNIIGSLIDGLTKPLSKKEKEKGRWNPPDKKRILFEGTLDEAQTFYQQTEYVGPPTRANICVYTDGFPIIIPTEERVKEMLTGTSHKPDEVIALQADRKVRSNEATVLGRANASTITRKKGEPVLFSPNGWTATVEMVAINAVMAGCKPEHLPVVLAIAESGLPIGSTHSLGQAVCLSGPVVKELGINTGCGMFGPGSPVNSPIGRSYYLMSRNVGGIPGVTRMNSLEGPFSNGGCCIAEDADRLPPGWEGLNEEAGYQKDESVVVVMMPGSIQHQGFRPGQIRSLEKSGHGGIARRLGVKGMPGPHNWMEYFIDSLFASREHGWTFIMVPQMALYLYEYGFKSKADIYEWLYKKCFEPVAKFRLRAGPDVETNGWMGIERTSGKHWKELPDDYMVPIMDSPAENLIIVAGGDEEVCEPMGGGRGQAYGIDAWR